MTVIRMGKMRRKTMRRILDFVAIEFVPAVVLGKELMDVEVAIQDG
jgi:hypothetical protein